MIDLDTRLIVDMIDSRKTEDVTRWLKTFPNLDIISRDGSNIYKSALDEAHPYTLQVSDRFHLLKNLSEKCGEELIKAMPYKVIISENIRKRDQKSIERRDFTITELKKQELVHAVRAR